MTMQRIPFVERDIETSSVEAEAEGVLRSAGLPASVHSLPIIDVRGTVAIGFVPCVIDAAWRGPRASATPERHDLGPAGSVWTRPSSARRTGTS